ncbi:2-amino-4-hydroxy-6-hydroxymethyldihydropteridine diphosphokinase [Motilimonas cestriensis]|uniref:2-amino-4-hydroxy-6- hydroxymethyldihydropteridine diphosphokinase n=1 Tax=Motilimonas cestriensis TaxID=2742685 RepID=UPI003DA3B21E
MTRATKLCYIALGSNQGDPVSKAQSAIAVLKQTAELNITAVSSLYRSAPMGPQDQPDYINGVIALETELPPLALLDLLQKIELEHGRERKNERWDPRTLDLDILLYGQENINNARLTVPHYGMKQREFVIYPLLEIAPQLMLPCGASLISLAAQCDRNGLEIYQTS